MDASIQTGDYKEVGIDNLFTVLYSAYVTPEFSEEYRITLEATRGFRFWLDGLLIFDKWHVTPPGPVNVSVLVPMQAGKAYLLRLGSVSLGVNDRNGALVSLRLLWESPSLPTELISDRVACAESPAACPFGLGLTAQFYESSSMRRLVRQRTVGSAQYNFTAEDSADLRADGSYAVRLVGHLRAPVSGWYKLQVRSEGNTYARGLLRRDGVSLWFTSDPDTIMGELMQNVLYSIAVEWGSNQTSGSLSLEWHTPWMTDSSFVPVPPEALCVPAPLLEECALGVPGFLGEYYDRSNGSQAAQGPVMVRVDPSDGLTWPADSETGVDSYSLPKSRNFSVSWRGTAVPAWTGVAAVRTNCTAGVSLMVGERLLASSFEGVRDINVSMCTGGGTPFSLQFSGSAGSETSADIAFRGLDPSAPPIRVCASTPQPACKLAASQGLVGEYYAGQSHQSFQFARLEPTMSLFFEKNDWSRPPSPGVPVTVAAQYWSARWTGFLVPNTTDDYYLYVYCNSATVSFWLEDRLLGDVTPCTGESFQLNAGKTMHLVANTRYSLRIELSTDARGPWLNIRWATPASLPVRALCVCACCRLFQFVCLQGF